MSISNFAYARIKDLTKLLSIQPTVSPNFVYHSLVGHKSLIQVQIQVLSNHQSYFAPQGTNEKIQALKNKLLKNARLFLKQGKVTFIQTLAV